MTHKEYELLYAYLQAQECFHRQTVQELQQRIRYREITTIDLVEMLLSKIAEENFKEFSKQVRIILKHSTTFNG